MPAVSIVVPTYNCAKYLPETLTAILRQDFDDFEIVVVDDGSTDDTEAVVRGVASDKVRYVRQSNSGGPSGPRNHGVQLAGGRYIALCDSDDVMLPGKLRAAVSFLDEHPHLGLVFGDMELCNDDGSRIEGTFLSRRRTFRTLPRRHLGAERYLIASADAHGALLGENFIGISGVVAPRNVLLKIGGFDETLSPAADWDIVLRIARDHDIGFLSMVGHRYRLRPSGLTGQGYASMAADQIRVLGKQFQQGLPRASRVRARSFLGEVFRGLGYYHRQRGDWAQARYWYWRSFREVPSWQALNVFCRGMAGDLMAHFLTRAGASLRDGSR